MFKTVTILKELEISSCDEIGKSHFFFPHFTMIVIFRHMSKERVFLSCWVYPLAKCAFTNIIKVPSTAIPQFKSSFKSSPSKDYWFPSLLKSCSMVPSLLHCSLMLIQSLPLQTAHFASLYLSVPWHLPFMLSSALLLWDFPTVPPKPAPKNISCKYSLRKKHCPVQFCPIHIRHSSLFIES